jgi:hypothetical protein
MTPTDSAKSGRPSGQRLSEVLAGIANDTARSTTAISDVSDAMGDRAFGALMFAFAAPNVVPFSAPGVSTILGAPLLFVALQLTLGFRAPWLPRFLAQRSVTHQSFVRVMNVIVPWIRRVERLLKPRLGMITTGPFGHVIGLVCAVLALVLMLPIPFGNMPPALAICILSLALLEEDGVATLLGLAAAAGALFIASGVIFGIVKAVSLLVRYLFGL